MPEGLALPEHVWRARHRVIVRILFAHSIGLFIFALARGFDGVHGLLEASPVALFGAIGASTKLSRQTRSLAATFGMVTASAILVHLSGGTIEAHFHFFVILGVISLYQSWRPFLLALGYVVIHHGVMGAIDAPSVYNHIAARNDPWTWAGIHGAFITAASAAQLVSWRFAETAHRQTELMLESAGQGIVGLDTDRRVTFINRGAASMLGVDRTAATGLRAQDVLGLSLEDGTPYPDERSPTIRTLSDGSENRVNDVWLGRGDGRFAAEVLTTPIVHRGEITGAMVTFRDLTDERAAAEELENTLSLLAATLESTADGILVVDRAGRITSFNQKFAEMWKIPGDVVEARDDEAAIASVLDQLKDPDQFLAKVRELYSQPDAQSHDVLEFKDGRVFDRYSQPQYVDGVSVGRVWSFRDVTDAKRLDEMKDGFLTAVSHEMRTPLTSVVGFASTLLEHRDRLSDEQHIDLLGRLDQNARKLQRLLVDILDLDRLGRGILEPRRQATDVGRLVDDLLAEIAVADERPVVVEARAGVFMLDRAKVERIVENLVSNAVRHTPDGTRIYIRAFPREEGVLIAVEDEGPGVPPDKAETIFEPFRQGPAIRKHSPGVGVGLSLVARFAELHAGRAWVEDRQGGGASFRVYLPAERATLDTVA